MSGSGPVDKDGGGGVEVGGTGGTGADDDGMEVCRGAMCGLTQVGPPRRLKRRPHMLTSSTLSAEVGD